jgi:hypothetical protein
VSRDEELQALARARVAAPEDLGLAARHARALVRAGDLDAAEAILVAALDRSPGHVELTAELDAFTRGRLRGSPWPSSRGDPSRTARSTAIGPSRGVVVERVSFDLERPAQTVVVPSPGRVFVTTREGLFSIDARGTSALVAALPRDRVVEATVLLPGGRILLIAGTHALVLVPDERGLARVPHRFRHVSSAAAGSSALLYVGARGEGRADALPLARPAETRVFARTRSPGAVALALAPGGDVIVAAEGSRERAAPGELVRLTSSGERRFARELPARSFGLLTTQPVVDARGSVFLGFPGDRLLAVDAVGATVLDVPFPGEPAGLAGAQGELLVCRRERGLAFVDAPSGRVRETLQGTFFGPPKIDGRGWVYARHADDLVAWDPDFLRSVALEVPGVATRSWDFAFAGDGRAVALTRAGDRSELVIIE